MVGVVMIYDKTVVIIVSGRANNIALTVRWHTVEIDVSVLGSCRVSPFHAWPGLFVHFDLAKHPTRGSDRFNSSASN